MKKNLHKSLFEIFVIFLRLGLTSFGGPIAHLGYFQNEFVTRREWVNQQSFADLVALCQFLPGPTSSQVGFALGMSRKGLLGGCMAWLGFTLPSALFLIFFASFLDYEVGLLWTALFHGLKIVAVAVVAQAVVAMARTLCPDWTRIIVALTTMVLVLEIDGPFAQIGALTLGAIAGILFCHTQPNNAAYNLSFSLSPRVSIIALTIFLTCLIGLPLLASSFGGHTLSLIDIFYSSGTFVFGGGHVVLPLLQDKLVPNGWIDNNTFISGYGLTQAMPGPLFSFAAYLGAAMKTSPNGLWGAMICLFSLFIPGILLVISILPFWSHIQKYKSALTIMQGVNASVVGLLGAALYTPLATTTLYTVADFAITFVSFLLLTKGKMPSYVVVGLTVGASFLSQFIH